MHRHQQKIVWLILSQISSRLEIVALISGTWTWHESLKGCKKELTLAVSYCKLRTRGNVDLSIQRFGSPQ